MPRGICASPFLRLVGRPNGNLCSALPHAELFNAWMLKAVSYTHLTLPTKLEV